MPPRKKIDHTALRALSKEFWARYSNAHCTCPKCGLQGIWQTNTGPSPQLDQKGEDPDFRDLNEALCCNKGCGWEGVAHDLAPRPENHRLTQQCWWKGGDEYLISWEIKTGSGETVWKSPRRDLMKAEDRSEKIIAEIACACKRFSVPFDGSPGVFDWGDL